MRMTTAMLETLLRGCVRPQRRPVDSAADTTSSGRAGSRDRLLRLLDEPDDIAHPENSAREAVGVEDLETAELLADAQEEDRLARDLPQRQRRAAARVTVHLREHDAVDADPLRERLADAD